MEDSKIQMLESKGHAVDLVNTLSENASPAPHGKEGVPGGLLTNIDSIKSSIQRARANLEAEADEIKQSLDTMADNMNRTLGRDSLTGGKKGSFNNTQNSIKSLGEESKGPRLMRSDQKRASMDT